VLSDFVSTLAWSQRSVRLKALALGYVDCGSCAALVARADDQLRGDRDADQIARSADGTDHLRSIAG
jgi:hypothetical protein